MFIQVLGMGCSKCQKLAEIAEKAAVELRLDFTLEKVQDLDKILALGVMITPAMLVDGQLKVSGNVPTLENMKKILSKS